MELQWIETPESSNVVRFAYDKDSEALYVEFKNGTYRFHGVGPEVYAAMLIAPSKGKFLAESVKGIYQSSRA
jgi:hypothetical protein